MFVVTVVFEVEHEAADAFLIRVKQQARDSLDNEPGCRRFDVSRCITQPHRILLYEIYDDADAFALHLTSDHFIAFDREISPISRSKQVESWHLE